MIDTKVKVKHEVNVGREYEIDEPEASFYREKETNLLYEVKLFPEFALIRLIMPEVQVPVHRIDIGTFIELFEEFYGDTKDLRSIMFGSKPSNFLVSKHHGRDE